MTRATYSLTKPEVMLEKRPYCFNIQADTIAASCKCTFNNLIICQTCTQSFKGPYTNPFMTIPRVTKNRKTARSTITEQDLRQPLPKGKAH